VTKEQAEHSIAKYGVRGEQWRVVPFECDGGYAMALQIDGHDLWFVLKDWKDMGIVRDRRWLVYGFHHGLMLRPYWLARRIVQTWNWVSCHTMGHEWFPEVCQYSPTPAFSETDEFCPNCCATRKVPRRREHPAGDT